MSGGSWNYFYQQVEEVADKLLHDRDSLRRAFGSHLVKVADALHEIEWVDSGDSAPEKEKPYIAAALGDNAVDAQIAVLRNDALAIIEQLQSLLKEVA